MPHSRSGIRAFVQTFLATNGSVNANQGFLHGNRGSLLGMEYNFLNISNLNLGFIKDIQDEILLKNLEVVHLIFSAMFTRTEGSRGLNQVMQTLVSFSNQGCTVDNYVGPTIMQGYHVVGA